MSVRSPWNQPPAALGLTAGEVHVWRADLPVHRTRLAALGRLLSDDEQARAARFRFARDRDRYVLARSLLRAILGRYLAIPPEQIRFAYGANGKPAIASPEDAGLRFNVSHSHDLALYAVCRALEVGVDVERIRLDIDCEQLARDIFSPNEVDVLLSLPASSRVAAFFRGWTLKEAYLKAHGGGLSLPLEGFDVALTPGTPAALLATRPDATEAAGWTLATLDPGPGYAAALAVEAPLAAIHCWVAWATA